jgi:hypothetical protein
VLVNGKVRYCEQNDRLYGMSFSDAGHALSLAGPPLFILHLASAKEVRRKEHPKEHEEL